MIRVTGLRAFLTVGVCCLGSAASASGGGLVTVAQSVSVDRSYCIYNRTKQHQVLVTAPRGTATLAPGMQACCTPSNGLCTAAESAVWVVELRREGKRAECAPTAERNAPIQLVRPGSYLLVREGRAPSKAGGDRPHADVPSVEIDVMTSDARVVATLACRPVH
jgi:hypothetical protein